jgi:hypothetical protein
MDSPGVPAPKADQPETDAGADDDASAAMTTTAEDATIAIQVAPDPIDGTVIQLPPDPQGVTGTWFPEIQLPPAVDPGRLVQDPTANLGGILPDPILEPGGWGWSTMFQGTNRSMTPTSGTERTVPTDLGVVLDAASVHVAPGSADATDARLG